MSFVHHLLSRFTQTVTAYAGDSVLMRAAVSASANVIVADGEVAGGEFETALAGLRADPVLEEELYLAIGRARTRAGRMQNVQFIEAIAARPVEQRHNVFLIAADVADHEGISPVEEKALGEVAAALSLDDRALLAR